MTRSQDAFTTTAAILKRKAEAIQAARTLAIQGGLKSVHQAVDTEAAIVKESLKVHTTVGVTDMAAQFTGFEENLSQNEKDVQAASIIAQVSAIGIPSGLIQSRESE